METVSDFEDMLDVLESHGVRYPIVGGLAFIHHAKPRHTNDMGLWAAPSPANVERAKRRIDNPRHQEDVRVLRRVKELRRKRTRPKRGKP